MSTTPNYDPDAIARACLDNALIDIVDIDDGEIKDICKDRHLAVPDPDDEDGWNGVNSTLAALIQQIRSEHDIEEPMA